MADNAEFNDPSIRRSVESILTDRLGGIVRLAALDRISDPERRNVLLRAVLEDGPSSAPSTVMIKQARPDLYQPDDPTNWKTRGLIADWAGLEFLNELGAGPAGCPLYYGGDRQQGLVVMEDLGEVTDLATVLMTGCAIDAERGLHLLAVTLGQMHAATIGHADQYHRIRSAISPVSSLKIAGKLRRDLSELLDRCQGLGVTPAPALLTEVDAVEAALIDPGPFLAYTHGDSCPDNCAFSGDRLRLFDFEIGDYRHALRDGLYERIRFPTCWCVSDIPEGVLQRMDDAYRAELIRGCPEAADDKIYGRAAACVCASWLLDTLLMMAPDALDADGAWGISTLRQRILMRLGAFYRFAASHDQLPALRGFADRLEDKLTALWGSDTMPMPLYDAFSRPYNPAPRDCEAFAAAVVANDVSEVRRLLERDRVLVNARLPEKDNAPVLYYAVEQNLKDLAMILIDRGASVLAAQGGRTVLERSVESGDLSLVDAVLDRGAALNQRTLLGRLPIYAAISAGNSDMIERLLERGAGLDLAGACRLGKLELAAEIIERSPAEVRRRFDGHRTLLHEMANTGDEKLAFSRLLLDRGADVNAADEDGSTPLHLASAGGHPLTIDLLVSAGADRSLKNRAGKTPDDVSQESARRSRLLAPEPPAP